MGFDAITLTVNELWVIHEFVRSNEHRREWSKEFEDKLMHAILYCVERMKASQANTVIEATIFFEEEELWLIHRQVSVMMQTGTEMTGRNILIKVMRLLTKLRQEEGDVDAGSASSNSNGSAGRNSGAVSGS